MRSGTVSLLKLSTVLLKMGAIAFGGVGTTLALLRSELAVKRGWIEEREVSEALAIVQTLPGSPGVLVIAFLGWRLAGWRGSIIAPFCFVAIPALTMVAASAALVAMPDGPAVRGAMFGLQVSIVGILAAHMLRMARTSARGARLTAVLIAGLAVGAFQSAAAAVVALGALGALVALRGPTDGAAR